VVGSLKVLMTAQKGKRGNCQKKFRLLRPFSGGSEALVQVVGGHVDGVNLGDISEVKGFMESGDLRVLASF